MKNFSWHLAKLCPYVEGSDVAILIITKIENNKTIKQMLKVGVFLQVSEIGFFHSNI